MLPWQEEAAVRAMELKVDGSPRFRTVLILVGRQSGKTTLLSLWSLWRLLHDDSDLVLGAAQNLDIAREAWQRTVDIAQEKMSDLVHKVRYANGEQCLYLTGGRRYRIAAATRGAGRGLSVDLLILDELREQRSHDAWAALSKTTMARPCGQIVAISNQGDDESVVLNNLRDAALQDRDPTIGLFEWSAPDGCPTDDPTYWGMSVPGLGHVVTEEALRSFWASDPPQVFRTEILCQRVSSMDMALDPVGWAHGSDPGGSVGPYRGRLDAGLDVAVDGHTVLVVSAVVGDGVRVEPVASWASTAEARADLPELLGRVNPRALVWFPGGPANSLAPYLQSLPYQRGLTGQDVNQACQGFADLVAAGKVQHNADALLDGQVATAARKAMGDGFRFTRGQASCNALYAAAGAAHVALVKEARKRRPIFVV